MSQRCRTEAEKLRAKYARTFKIPEDDVEIDEWPGDEAFVFTEKHPTLPKWSTGKCP